MIAAVCAVAVGMGASEAEASTLVACWRYQAQEHGYFKKPRHCAFTSPANPGTGFGTVDTVKLRWRHWGERRAVAKGVRLGNDRFRARTRVTLSRRVRCDGDYIYTRATFKDQTGPAFGLDLFRCPM